MPKQGTYRKRLIAQMESLGTWREEYSATVNACAKILERQDELIRQYKAEDNTAKTADGKKSATLQALEANERNLLSYLRALGLTPDTVKRMEKQRAGEKDASPMDKLASALMGFDDA